MTARPVQRLVALIAVMARWVGRTAIVAAVFAAALGIAVWTLVVATDVASGRAVVGLLLLCLVPATSFVMLWWATRRVGLNAAQLADDLGVMLDEIKATPERLGTAFDRLQSARRPWARISALRHAVTALRGSGQTAAARDRIERLYVTAVSVVPASAAVGALGLLVLAAAGPIVLVIALVD